MMATATHCIPNLIPEQSKEEVDEQSVLTDICLNSDLVKQNDTSNQPSFMKATISSCIKSVNFKDPIEKTSTSMNPSTLKSDSVDDDPPTYFWGRGYSEYNKIAGNQKNKETSTGSNSKQLISTSAVYGDLNKNVGNPKNKDPLTGSNSKQLIWNPILHGQRMYVRAQHSGKIPTTHNKNYNKSPKVKVKKSSTSLSPQKEFQSQNDYVTTSLLKETDQVENTPQFRMETVKKKKSSTSSKISTLQVQRKESSEPLPSIDTTNITNFTFVPLHKATTSKPNFRRTLSPCFKVDKRTQSTPKFRHKAIQVSMDIILPFNTKIDKCNKTGLKIMKPIAHRRTKKTPKTKVNKKIQKHVKSLVKESSNSSTFEMGCGDVSGDSHRHHKTSNADLQNPQYKFADDIKAKLENCKGKCTINPSSISVVSYNNVKNVESVFQRQNGNYMPKIMQPEKKISAARQLKTRKSKKRRKSKKKSSLEVKSDVILKQPTAEHDLNVSQSDITKTDSSKKVRKMKKRRKITMPRCRKKILDSQWEGLTKW